jgi:hypothetical protein
MVAPSVRKKAGQRAACSVPLKAGMKAGMRAAQSVEQLAPQWADLKAVSRDAPMVDAMADH